jgi:hypothetical protein
MIIPCKILVREAEGKRSFGKNKCRWKGIMKLYFKKHKWRECELD